MATATLLQAAQGCAKRTQPDSFIDAKAKVELGRGSLDPTDLHSSGEPTPEVHAAARCAECHGELFSQWKESRHARAATSDSYLRARKVAGGAECARCHEPLAKLVEADHPASRDGVNCDVCHTMATVEVTGPSATFRLRPDERTKYGPLCDAVDHYFHKMGCSPLHAESQFCAACHHWSTPVLAAAEVRVFGEYEEWRESGYAKRSVSCQDCHMPWNVAPLAVGSAARVNAAHHGFWGETGELRKGSLTVKTTIEQTGERLRLQILVKNSGAGHYVPTGLPERRVVLEATTLDASERELDRAERTYGKILVNVAGDTVPFFSAVKQASDTRLAPEEERKETLELAASAAATAVQVRLVWIDLALDVARALAYEPAREVMYEERRALGRPKGAPNRRGTITRR
jgi:Cytochrome c554 and c-prime